MKSKHRLTGGSKGEGMPELNHPSPCKTIAYGMGKTSDGTTRHKVKQYPGKGGQR